MVPPDSDRISRVLSYSGAILRTFRFRLQGFHLLWRRFPSALTSVASRVVDGPTTPEVTSGLGFFPFARRYLENHFCFLFLRLLGCFRWPGWSLMMTELLSAGLPHSEIKGYAS